MPANQKSSSFSIPDIRKQRSSSDDALSKAANKPCSDGKTYLISFEKYKKSAVK
jgi:hypothetical protein